MRSSDSDEDLSVFIDVGPRRARADSPDDYVSNGTAELFRWDEGGERGPALATARWTLVEYGAAMNDGVPLFDVADAASQDLHNLHCSLFDDRENFRSELDADGGVGHDVLVIDEVSCAAEQEYAPLVRELIEHLVSRWGRGCALAVYIEDREPKLRLHEVLRERGFRWHKGAAATFWFVDLAAPRPSLDGEQRRTPPDATKGKMH